MIGKNIKNPIYFYLYFLLFILAYTTNLSATTVTDLMNRKIEVPDNITCIAALGPGALRLLVYMDALNKVCGVEAIEKDKLIIHKRPYAFANYEYIENLPTIGNGGPNVLPNFEQLLKNKIQLIFATFYTRDQIELIQNKTGIPVVALRYGNTNTMYSNDLKMSLTLIGKILKKEKRAKEINTYLKNIINYLKEKSSKMYKTDNITAYLGGLGFKGSHGFYSTTFYYPPFELLNLKNVLNDFPKLEKLNHIILDKESILLLNPDFIFIDSNGLSIISHNYDKDKGFYYLLKAVQNDNVYLLLSYNNYYTNIDNALINTFFIGKTLYPDAFRDIDIENKANEIYNFFIGRSFFKEIQDLNNGCKKLIFRDNEISW